MADLGGFRVFLYAAEGPLDAERGRKFRFHLAVTVQRSVSGCAQACCHSLAGRPAAAAMKRTVTCG